MPAGNPVLVLGLPYHRPLRLGSLFPGKKTTNLFFFFFFAKHLLNKQHVNRNSCFRLHRCLIVSSRACLWQAVGRPGRGRFPPPRGLSGGTPRNTAPGPSVSLTLRTDRQTDRWTWGSDSMDKGLRGAVPSEVGPRHLGQIVGRPWVVVGPGVASAAAGRPCSRVSAHEGPVLGPGTWGWGRCLAHR